MGAAPTHDVDALRREIRAIYLGDGERPYGLYGINQLQHALQSAVHAEQQDLGAPMVIACLLHDVGHMIHHLGEAPAEEGVDDVHEERGAEWTAARFPAPVSEPIRLHVAAKRYLCTTEPDYEATLAKDSLISLALQGGRMSEAEIAAFRADPFFEDAVTLRRIDEIAKDPRATTPTLDDILDKWLSLALA